MSTPTPRRTVVVLGAGYAGVLCANRLRASLTAAEAARTRVRLVNPTDVFWDRVRLHELAAGSRVSASVPLRDVLHPDVEIVVGRAERIDASRRHVHLAPVAADPVVPYDLLVHAVGSEPHHDVPGAHEHTHAIGSSAGATAARTALASAAPGARVVVVGGGLTGVETAAEVAERRPDADVVLLTGGDLVPTMRPAARRSVARRLRRLGVTLREGVRVDRVEDRRLLADGGTTSPSTSPCGPRPSAPPTSPPAAACASTTSGGCGSGRTCAASTTRRSSARVTPSGCPTTSALTCAWAAPPRCHSAVPRPRPCSPSCVGRSRRPRPWATSCSA
ncbi:FAD-dependent oxidoreductase [Cellulomonas sp. ATA003]|uniref:FAD-dependent oxidoreductase n=1 Tax=Cellulomonas sp. ATA003 TaxID=3073064 RepID=UPI0028737F59|nr:FAD-dependent oxidoreductase [Cellulomonas sp. ATA003]WNB86561.1 FAD-dependent oxidoreductase [Cellulomonas sp. ATA003]